MPGHAAKVRHALPEAVNWLTMDVVIFRRATRKRNVGSASVWMIYDGSRTRGGKHGRDKPTFLACRPAVCTAPLSGNCSTLREVRV